MNRRALLFSVLMCGVFLIGNAASLNDRLLLTIQVEGMKVKSGKVLVAIYNTEEGFCTDPMKAYKRLAVKVEDEKTSVVVPDLPNGEYAIVVVHDVNGNNKMDTNLIGLPKEDYAVSNDAKGFLGPPSFKDATFHLAGNLTIIMRF